MADTINLSVRTASGALWSSASVFGRQVLSLLSLGILARLIPPTAYGLLGMANTVGNFILIFRDLGTGSALIQKESLTDRLIASVFWMNVVLGLALFLAVFSLSWPAAAFFRQPELTPVMQLLSLSFVLSSLGVVPSALLNRELAFRTIAIVDLVGWAAGTITSITMAFLGFGVWSLVTGTLVTTGICSIALLILCPWRPCWGGSLSEIRSIASYSLNLSAYAAVNYAARNADSVIIGRFLGPATLGIYQMAYQLMLYPLQNVNSVLGRVLHPAFSRLQNDDVRFRDGYLRSTAIIATITFPMLAGLFVTADPFVRVILGEKWLPVVPLLYVFCPLGLLQTVMSTVGVIYTAKGRTDWMFRWGLVVTGVVIAALLVGLSGGLMGIAVAYAVAIGLLFYPTFVIPFRLIRLPVRLFIRHLWEPLSLSLIMALLAGTWLWILKRMFVTNLLAQLLTTVVLGCAVYLFLLAWRRPAALKDALELLAKMGLRRIGRAGPLT